MKLNCDEALKLRVGDKLWEYAYGLCLESIVSSLPKEVCNGDDDTGVEWKSKIINDKGEETVIDYFISRKYQHYGPNVYTYKAYLTNKEIQEELARVKGGVDA